MRVKFLIFPFMFVSLSQLLSGCAAQIAAQNAMLDQCMERNIQGAKYVSGRTLPSEVVKIAHMECEHEFFKGGMGSSQQPKMSPEQKRAYEQLASNKISQSPRYRFAVKNDKYKNEVSVSGIDYISNSGSSENYYTKAILSAQKVDGGKVRYYIQVLRSGLEKAELKVAYFKGGNKLDATPVGGDVNCVNRVFCFWTEGAVVEIPQDFLSGGKPLDFKMSGRVDSDSVEIPSDYISMFMTEVSKAM